MSIPLASWRELVFQENTQLARVDPIEMNLLVAKGILALADLDIPRYQEMADDWAADIARRLPNAEACFYESPQHWKNDVNFFRLCVACEYLENQVGIGYNEHQREVKEVYYTNPSDLFVNGVMDTRQGTCGNMAVLHVAIGWRMGWPVSLACAGPHFICRYDDGQVTHNIEATQSGFGGVKSDPDEYLIKEHHLSPTAIRCGSDLRALSPVEMLGCFLGLRGRHYSDSGDVSKAMSDFLLGPLSVSLQSQAVQASD